MNGRTQAQLARNEDFFRNINDSIDEIASTQGKDSHKYQFMCECSDTACMEWLELTLDQYSHVRDDPTRFVVAPGHVMKEIEHVVETKAHHQIVEKDGIAGAMATRLEAATSINPLPAGA
jgi:hypothetical protein